jgi:hypothetical protein
MRALDEPFLLIHWDKNPLSGIAIRRNGKQAMRVSLHHRQLVFFVQVPPGNFLPKKLLTYPRRRRGLSLLSDDSLRFLLPHVFALLPLNRKLQCVSWFPLLCTGLNSHWPVHLPSVGNFCLLWVQEKKRRIPWLAHHFLPQERIPESVSRRFSPSAV